MWVIVVTLFFATERPPMELVYQAKTFQDESPCVEFVKSTEFDASKKLLEELKHRAQVERFAFKCEQRAGGEGDHEDKL